MNIKNISWIGHKEYYNLSDDYRNYKLEISYPDDILEEQKINISDVLYLFCPGLLFIQIKTNRDKIEKLITLILINTTTNTIEFNKTIKQDEKTTYYQSYISDYIAYVGSEETEMTVTLETKNLDNSIEYDKENNSGILFSNNWIVKEDGKIKCTFTIPSSNSDKTHIIKIKANDTEGIITIRQTGERKEIEQLPESEHANIAYYGYSVINFEDLSENEILNGLTTLVPITNLQNTSSNKVRCYYVAVPEGYTISEWKDDFGTNIISNFEDSKYINCITKDVLLNNSSYKVWIYGGINGGIIQASNTINIIKNGRS